MSSPDTDRAVDRLPARGFLWAASLSLLAWALVIVFAVWASRAFAAEQTPQWEVVAYPPGRDLREDRPNLVAVAGPFASRMECTHAIAFVKLAKPVRLRCDRVE